ncbi:MAG: D-alanine--D-alanine ligase [Oscillospiraceae bacterium]|jgi:D-alanine-D-alanine ligase|nr:D-alanine--D-alanine ligase [Oscillospiraceae bacterium]
MKKTMAVLFGGRSVEHDVSIVSAVQWMASADPSKYDLVPVYLAHDGAWYTGEPLKDLNAYKPFNPLASGIVKVLPDLTANARTLLSVSEKPRLFGGSKPELKVEAVIDVAVPIFHGLNGEDGTIQGVLELMNLPYTSSGLVGSSVGMDKIAMKQLFRGMGFPILDFHWATRDAWNARQAAILDEIESKIPYPLFVKPANLGSSIGIAKAKTRAALIDALDVAFSYDRRAVIEPAVNDPVEVNCSALGFDEDVRVSVCEMPVSWQEFLTFEEKYIPDAKAGESNKTGSKAAELSGVKNPGGMANAKRRIPAPIGDEMTARVQALSAEIFRALDCKGVVRIDYIIDPASNTLYVNEINTIPGSLAYYLWDATDLPYPKLIDRMVELAERAHERKNEAKFGFDSAILKAVSIGGGKR